MTNKKNENTVDSIRQRQAKRDEFLAELEKKHGPARPLTAEEQDALDTQIHNMNRMRKPGSNQTE